MENLCRKTDVPWFSGTSRMVRCCKFIASGTCMNCTCAKSGSTCTDCAPGGKDRCRNVRLRTRNDDSAVLSNQSQLESPPTAVPASELARGQIEAALKAAGRKPSVNNRRSEESSTSPTNDHDQADGPSVEPSTLSIASPNERDSSLPLFSDDQADRQSIEPSTLSITSPNERDASLPLFSSSDDQLHGPSVQPSTLPTIVSPNEHDASPPPPPPLLGIFLPW